VPETFVHAGVPFEFVDISKASLHMDLDRAETRLRRGKCAGLLYAHTYGEPSTPFGFFEAARALHPEMVIVDDRCLCTPEFDVESMPSVADVVLFSTGYAKIVDLNSGGYAFVNERIALETTAGLTDWDTYRGQIEARLESSLFYRAALNEIYASRLPAEIQLPAQYQQWRFNIRVRNKTAVLRAIFNDGLFASSHYPALGNAPNVPEAASLANNVINLFNDHHFDSQKAERVCEIIQRGNAKT
jgi:dTDP-4-amino-4,6-dideoxygalactose transaminase